MKKAIGYLGVFLILSVILIPASENRAGLAILEPPAAAMANTAQANVPRSLPAAAPKLRTNADFGRMPLYFIANRGQLDPRVAFYVQGGDKSLYFTSEGITFLVNRFEAAKGETGRLAAGGGIPANAAPDSGDSTLGGYVIKLDFVGTDAVVKPVGRDKTEAVVSYFKGRPDDWHAGLPTYSEIVYPNLWPGIDLVYYGTVNRLKYEFIVHPGADPSRIRLAYRGVEKLAVNEAGQLEVATARGSFRDDVPVAYQEIDSQRKAVPLRYAIAGEEPRVSPCRTESAAAKPEHPEAELRADAGVYGFAVDDYDARRTLVLDPAIFMYSGYVGGQSNEAGFGIAADTSGSVYITGNTSSTQTTFPVSVGPDLTHNASIDAFVAKVKPDGSGLVYCGYIGGAYTDYGTAIAVDGSGNAYITGYASSPETQGFPALVGPDLTHNGGYDAFVAKVNASGTSLAYCGYIGGGADDRGNGIAVDSSGNAYITGQTRSAESNFFPVVVGPDLTHNGGNDAFVAKVNAVGSGLDYCGYIGGSQETIGLGIAVDSAGNAYVTGYTASTEAQGFPVLVGPDLTHNGSNDAFVAKVAVNGASLICCGYIGGSGSDSGYGIAVDATGNAYIGGSTNSTQATFPVTVGPDLTQNGSQDAFVAKVNASGGALVYCGYLGGSGMDNCYGLAIDGSGNAYLAGTTASAPASFPVLSGPDFTLGGTVDGYVAKVNAGGTALMYCGYIGGLDSDDSHAIAVDIYDNAYVTGTVPYLSTDFPVMVGPDLTQNGNSEVFVAKFTTPFVAAKHAIGDFDGDGTDELAVDFGASGAYLWDDNAWTQLTAFNTESLQAADVDGDSVDEIIMDLGASGLYLWDGGGATQLSGVNVDVYAAGDVDADGSAEVVGDFGPSGLWLYNGGAWTQLSGVNADYMTTANLDGAGGEEIIGDFGRTGMWIWNAGAWTQLSGVNADYMTAGNTDGTGGDDLAGDFSATGLWLYSNSLWTQLSGVNAESVLIAATDLSGDDIVGDFSLTGLWLWNGTTWTIMSGVNAEMVIRANADADANDELAADFGAMGLWLFDGGAWSLLSGQNPEALLAGDLNGDSQDEVLADLGALGLWMWQGGTWTQLSPGNPQ